jgi:hypothetical protein
MWVGMASGSFRSDDFDGSPPLLPTPSSANSEIGNCVQRLCAEQSTFNKLGAFALIGEQLGS